MSADGVSRCLGQCFAGLTCITVPTYQVDGVEATVAALMGCMRNVLSTMMVSTLTHLPYFCADCMFTVHDERKHNGTAAMLVCRVHATVPTRQVDEVEAAVAALMGGMGDPIHDDGEHAVAAAAALVHLGLCHRAVAGPQGHHFQHVLCAVHRVLQQPAARFRAAGLCGLQALESGSLTACSAWQ